MPSSTLTWSVPYKGTAPASATVANTWTKLVETLQAADDAADFPWVVCSSDTSSASTQYITLKPKSGGAGRILFLYAVTTTDGAWNTTIQYNAISPSGSIFATYIAGATTDTPANLRGGSSSPIFTGQINLQTAPVSPPCTTVIGTSGAWEVIANVDAVVAYQIPTNDSSGFGHPSLGAGGLLVDFSDEAHNASFHLSNISNWVPSSTVGSAQGFHHKHTENGTVEHWGYAYTWETPLQQTRGRNNASKKVYFCRQQLGSYQAVTNAETYRYELRQIGFGVTPLASREVLSNGSTVYARPMGGGTSLTWWACNFKLNV